MKSSYIMRAQRFIEEVYPYIENKTRPYDCWRAIEQFNANKSRKVAVAHGVSRVAFITSDYVVKFDYDEYEVRRVGGCESEVNFYQFAKREGFSYLFAEITPFTYKGRTFYIMPRVYGIGRYEYSYAEDMTTGEEESFLRRYLYDLHDENYGWYHGQIVVVDYACNVFQQGEKDSSEDTNSSC